MTGELCSTARIGGDSVERDYEMFVVGPVRLTTAFFILYCISVHIVGGWILLVDPEAASSTVVAGPLLILGSGALVGVAMILVGLIATLALYTPFPINVLLLLPQQTMFLMSAASVISSIIEGHFADGVIRSRGFIAEDHLNVLLVAFFHAWVVVLRGILSTREGPGMFYQPRHPLEKLGL